MQRLASCGASMCFLLLLGLLTGLAGTVAVEQAQGPKVVVPGNTGWMRGPLSKDTYYWGAVVPVEHKGTGFFFADFQGDKVTVVGGKDGKEWVLKAHEVAWYNNSIQLPPREAGVTGRAKEGK